MIAMRSILAAIFLVVILVMTGSDTIQSQPSLGFEVGKRFPTLSLPALDDGRALSLADFRGQKVVLHVFASW